jgi:hypothetical protein
MIKPLSYNDAGKELFTFELIGVNGSGGKNYDTSEIIKTKQTEILMIYLADMLKLGNDSHGSFALAESKNNLLAHAIQHHLSFITDIIMEQLVPQTLMVNGFDLPKEQYPKLTYSDLDNEDIDELGKLVQRLASTNMIPRDLRLINEILNRSGFEYRLTENDAMRDKEFSALIPYDEIFTNNESGASEGMEEGLPNGTGASLVNNSSLNVENKS